ncbi:MAG: hypothetical protein IAE86_19750 [Burkholderiaceae bacterium]|nr:hypothetical protein [Burkholderiaceae bacterium]
MATNRVQLQRGLSITELFDRYGTEDKCRQALEAALAARFRVSILRR